MTDGQSSCLSWCQTLMARVLLLSDSCGFADVGLPLWREDWSVLYNPCWAFQAQSFLGPIPSGLMTLFYCLRFESPPTWVKVKVKVTLRLMVSQSVCLDVEPKVGLLTIDFFSKFLSCIFFGGALSDERSGPSCVSLFHCSLREPPTWSARSPYLYAPVTAWPIYTPRLNWTIYYWGPFNRERRSYFVQNELLVRLQWFPSYRNKHVVTDDSRTPQHFLQINIVGLVVEVCSANLTSLSRLFLLWMDRVGLLR
jgi:hypothetical protein